jgi:tRNA threonylcarbamoyl adenosine modification protein (Sua5/YciO/YrdC/YwlC family)
MLIRLFEDNPNKRQIRQIVETLENDGLIIFPTDSVYAIGCSLNSNKAIQKLASLKGVKAEKATFSIICNNLRNISEYSRINDDVFRLMKKNLPGPFTFILPGSKQLPNIFKNKRKSIGIRIPDHFIPLSIVEELGYPLVTTSIHDEDEVVEYTTDPELIHEKYKNKVDYVLDGGYGENVATTIVDCANGEIIIERQGIGVLEE